MDYRYHPPPVPGFSRWWRMTRAYPGQSILRMLTYEKLITLRIAGRVLDMGGGRNAKYLSLLPAGLAMESVNIDPKIAPTHLVEPGKPLPFADGMFDAVICLNTLEHIYDSIAVLNELFRVVKPGGQVHVMVPFMFRIHGHPDDYFRATPSWWRETFSRAGFTALDFFPLVWGRASTAAVVPGFRGLFPRLRLHLAMMRDIIMTRLAFRGSALAGARGERICNTAPGWFMTGHK